MDPGAMTILGGLITILCSKIRCVWTCDSSETRCGFGFTEHKLFASRGTDGPVGNCPKRRVSSCVEALRQDTPEVSGSRIAVSDSG